MVLVDYIGIFLHFRILLTDDCTCIQYWCIDGKYIIYVARLRNGWGGGGGGGGGGGRALASLSIRFVPSYINVIFTVSTVYTNIIFIMQ